MTLNLARRDLAIVERLTGQKLSRQERIEALMHIRHLSASEAMILVLRLEGTLVLMSQTKFHLEGGSLQRLYTMLRETGADETKGGESR
jgi:hypothetical protein